MSDYRAGSFVCCTAGCRPKGHILAALQAGGPGGRPECDNLHDGKRRAGHEISN